MISREKNRGIEVTILNKLNDKQRLAAEKINGQVLILAGAGSGKTRTITYRIAHMVDELGISPYNILAVTFTNKAAREMRERVEDLIGEDARRVTLSTFHSFGLRLLRIFGDRLGYSSNFTIYDMDDGKRVIKTILKNSGREKDFKTRDVLSQISKAKENKIGPDEYEKLHQYDNGKIVAEFYRSYNSVLKQNNAMDFSDILVNTEKLLDIPDILKKVQEKYKYIMVDEYQDTNAIQYSIIQKIAEKYKNLCVVGDENQSIYRFRGADIQNILNFGKDYPDATVVKLEENYRSTAIILDAANSVIKNNKNVIDKKLWTKKVTGDKITLKECDDARREAGFVITEIIKAHAKGRKYRDFTILYRTNAQSRLFEEGFLRQNIPYKIFGTIAFYQRAEIKDILGYLSVINNVEDNLNLQRILNVPKRKIGAKTIEKIEVFAKNTGISLFESLGRADEILGLSATLKQTLVSFYNMLNDFREASEEILVSELYEEIIKSIGYRDYLKTTYDDFETRIENIDELQNSIVELEKVVDNMTLQDYLENVSLISATDDLDDDRDYVKLMTIHNSKGLEFPQVFLVGMEEGLFPGNKAEFDNEELEEERRLCYVGITRAEEKLFISYAKSRITYGDIDNYRLPSRFIDEISENLIDRVEQKKPTFATTTKVKNSNFKNKITLDEMKNNLKNYPYKIGEKVKHKKLGLGLGLVLGYGLGYGFREGFG